MAAICPAAKIDSHLRKLICFTIAKLCKKSACDDGDNKIGNQTTNINWKVPPKNWPDIPFINPNNVSKINKVKPKEKWAMLFAALSCLLGKGIDNILDEFDKFVFRVELLALENSMFDIMDKCNNLRTLRKLWKDLETTWVRDTCSYGLGLSISLMPIAEGSSSFHRLYSDLEKECKNGQKPDFLKTLSTFSSMKELDAKSALLVAEKCLEHDTEENQRNQRKRKRSRSSSSTIIQSKKKSPDVCALSLLTAQPQSQQTASSQGLVPLVSTPKDHIQQTHLAPPSSAACQNQRLHIASASPIMSCNDQPTHTSLPQSTAPVQQSTPAQVRQSIPAPVHQFTPAPVHQSTLIPVYKSTLAPVHQPTPVPVHQSTLAPVHQSTLVPVYQSTPVPVHQSTPVSVHQSTLAQVRQSTPAPVHQSTLAPVNQPTPVSVQQSTAVPDQQTHMISAANKNLQEPTVPVINCSIQSIGASLTNVSPMRGTSDSIWSQKYCDACDSTFTVPDPI